VVAGQRDLGALDRRQGDPGRRWRDLRGEIVDPGLVGSMMQASLAPVCDRQMSSRSRLTREGRVKLTS